MDASERPAQNLDPALLVVGPGALVNANLVKILPSEKVAPDLATYTISKNGLVYTFTIHSNARFANGHAVTAADALFSLERSLAPSMPVGLVPTNLGLIAGAAEYHAGRAKSVAGIKVLGRRVLQIRITKPVAYFLQALAASTAGDVLDPAVVRGKPIGVPDPKTGVFKHNYLTDTCTANQGAGPFTFVCRNHSSNPSSFASGRNFSYALEPNPHYYGRRPRIRLQWAQIAPDAAYRLYLQGKLDLISPLLPAYVKRSKGRTGEYHQYPSSAVDSLNPNTHLAPFNNVHCRLALAYAIDRIAVARVSQVPVHPTYAIVPKGMLGYYPGTDNPHYNPARARAELARCPGRTIPVELVYTSKGGFVDNVFKAVLTMLQTVGMNVRLKPLSNDAYVQVVSQPLDKTQTQLVLDGWQQDYPDPQDYCTLRLRSGQPLDTGGWHNDAYDRLVDRAEIERNRRVRAQLYIKAQHIALSQGAWISLSYAVNQALVKPYVHGLIGSEAYDQLVPKDLDWSTVSIGKH